MTEETNKDAAGESKVKTTTKAPKKAEAKRAKPKAVPKKRAVVSVGEITIDTNVPIPAVTERRAKYPFDLLEPGQSFLVECPKTKVKAMKANLKGSARRITAKTGAQFIVLYREEEKGIRCWRVGKDVKEKVFDESQKTTANKTPDLSAFGNA